MGESVQYRAINEGGGNNNEETRLIEEQYYREQCLADTIAPHQLKQTGVLSWVGHMPGNEVFAHNTRLRNLGWATRGAERAGCFHGCKR